MKKSSLCLFSIIISFCFYGHKSYAYDISEAINDALNNSEEIVAGKFNMKASEAAIAKAKSGFLPQVSAKYVAGRSYKDDSSNYGSNTAKLVLEQNIYKGHSNSNIIKASKAQNLIYRSKVEAIKAKVIGNAVKTYHDMFLSMQKRGLKSEQVKLMTISLEEAEVKYKSGVINATDLAEAHAHYSAAKAELISSDCEVEKMKSSFYNVFGNNKFSQLKEVKEGLFAKFIPNAIEECYKEASFKNYDITAAKMALRQQHFIHKATKGGLMPSVNVSASLSSGDESRNSVSMKSVSKDLALSLEVPIFKVDAIASIREMKNIALSKEYDLLKVEKSVTNQVGEFWNDYKSVSTMLGYYKEKAKAKKKLVEAMSVEFSAGTKTMSDLMKARAEAFESEIKVLESKKSIVDAGINLLHCIGRLNEAAIVKDKA